MLLLRHSISPLLHPPSIQRQQRCPSRPGSYCAHKNEMLGLKVFGMHATKMIPLNSARAIETPKNQDIVHHPAISRTSWTGSPSPLLRRLVQLSHRFPIYPQSVPYSPLLHHATHGSPLIPVQWALSTTPAVLPIQSPLMQLPSSTTASDFHLSLVAY